MFELTKIMTVIILNIWILQLIYYYKKGADAEYEMSLEKPKIRKEIEEIVKNVREHME